MSSIRAVKFFNFTDEPFIGVYAKVEYPFAVGASMFIEEWKANHFAKHLIDRELNKLNKLTSNQVMRQELYKKCVLDVEAVANTQAEIETQLVGLNIEKPPVKAPFCSQCDSKGVRHKSVCPTLKQAKEEEFEGLNNAAA